MIPRPGKAADRPGTDQTRTGWAIKRDGRAASGRREMGGGSIRPDIDGSPLEQRCKLCPIEPKPPDRGSASVPHAGEIGALGRVRPLGGNDGEPAFGKPAGNGAPPSIG